MNQSATIDRRAGHLSADFEAHVLEVVLYRVKDTVPKMVTGLQPLDEAHDRERREVARMKGLPATVLKKN